MALERPRLAVGLLDVLEQLPRDALREGLWLYLTKHGSLHTSERLPSSDLGRPFRLCCHRTLRLADQLTQRLVLENSDVNDHLQAAQGAFLARQEGLQQLTLDDDVHGRENESFIAECIIIKTLLLGGATCQRLRSVRIDTPYGCTPAVGMAVQRFCPAVQELQLKVDPHLSSTFFQPLQLCLSLSKVGLASWQGDLDCGPALRALAALPALHTLSLEGHLAADDVPLLAALTRVVELYASKLVVAVTMADGPAVAAALGGMTQLAHFAVPHWRANTLADDAAVLAVVAEQLTGLRRLQSLSLGSCTRHGTTFDRGFDALRRLSGLTQLACPPLSPQRERGVGGSGSSFPLLQHLQICGAVRGAELAATLWPLGKLRELTFTVSLDKDPAEPLGTDGRAASALWMVALALGTQPDLQRVTLTLVRKDMTQSQRSAPAACTALLLPLRDHLTSLHLAGLPTGTWGILLPILHQATRLAALHVSRSPLNESGLLLVVGQHMPALRRLLVDGCSGVSGATAVALAHVRLQPLRVQWVSPALTVEERRAFQAAAHAGVTVEGVLPD